MCIRDSPKNVSEIGGGAFSNCSSLATAEILGPVKELTGTTGVFLGCAALKNVTLPDTLTNIGTGTFNGCASLEKIDLPAGLTEIGREALDVYKRQTQQRTILWKLQMCPSTRRMRTTEPL